MFTRIPLAVEFLINLVLRWTCFVLAGAFGLLALVALIQAWSWWILMPALAITLGSFVCAVLIRPQGKLAFDRSGPIVIVPVLNPVDPGLPKGQGHYEQE